MGNIVVIVPTLNRPRFVDRVIRWYTTIEIPVFIGDSSEKPQFSRMCPTGNPFVHYLHTPGQNELQASYTALEAVEVSNRSRLSMGVRFIAWAGDDDLFLPGPLRDCQTVLDLDSGGTSAQGHALIFVIKGNAVYGEIESTKHHPHDAFFRVYRKEVIGNAWKQVKDLPRPILRREPRYGDQCGLPLDWWLQKHDSRRLPIGRVHVLRQVHPWRLTVPLDYREPWRSRLGHRFPRIQYLKQRLNSWCWHQARGQCVACSVLLPSLRHKRSPYYSDFAEVENFLQWKTL